MGRDNSTPMPNQTWIPVELAHQVKLDGIVPEFKVFVAAKLSTPGCFSRNSFHFDRLCLYSGYQPRVVLKHLNQLVRKGWVGIDGSKKMYYIRSWEWFYDQDLITNRRSVLYKAADVKTFNAFLVGSVVCNHVKKHEDYCRAIEKSYTSREKRLNNLERKRKPGKSVVINRRSTTSHDQSVSSTALFSRPQYFGFSNKGIASLLGCSETHARDLKHKAEQSGYLQTFPRLNEFMTLGAPDFLMRNSLYNGKDSDFVKRLRHTTEKRKGKKVVLLVQQLHDEIKPLMTFRQINYKKRIELKRSKQLNSISTVTPDQKNKILPILLPAMSNCNIISGNKEFLALNNKLYFINTKT